MKKTIFLTVCLVALFLFPAHPAAQQIPVPTGQLLGYTQGNPAYFPEADLHSLGGGYTQRDASLYQWTSATQFLRFLSKPLGRKQGFAWGSSLLNDRVHTEQRLSGNFNVTGRILGNGPACLSVGIYGGFMHWSSKYSGRNLFDAFDPVAIDRTNFFELDAGLHKMEIVPHNDTFADDNMLTRGQEVAV
ncbi:MAG: hypothetical protein AAF570_24385, partial [Bacteroidota bacterium]